MHQLGARALAVRAPPLSFRRLPKARPPASDWASAFAGVTHVARVDVLLAHPEFTFHLKQCVRAHLPARAMPILDQTRRREIIAAILHKIGGRRNLEAWVEGSRLVAVDLLVE